MASRSDLSLLFDVFATSSAVRVLLGKVLAGTGLTPEEYAVYSAVAVRGPLSVTALAEACGIPLTTASDYVRTLVRRGHLTRTRNPTDSRSWLLALSPVGSATHAKAQAAFVTALALVRDRMTVPEGDARRALQDIEAACSGVVQAGMQAGMQAGRVETTGA